MTDTKRWTVRGIERKTLAMLANVRQTSGGTFGEFINESVAFWYDALDEDDANDDEEDA
jgi:hypothetical protein